MVKSTIVLTHHKAASTLLRRLVKLNWDYRFTNVDYAGEYWSAKEQERAFGDVYEKINKQPIDYFDSSDHLYGPLRKSVDHNFEGFTKLIIARDPVSTLHSEYVSFAYTHPAPSRGVPRQAFLDRREKLLIIGLEGYIKERYPELLLRMSELADYSKQQDTFVLPYELILKNRKQFIEKFYQSVGSKVPIALVCFGLNIIERKAGVRRHRSRNEKFNSVKMSTGLQREIALEFDKYKQLWKVSDVE